MKKSLFLLSLVCIFSGLNAQNSFEDATLSTAYEKHAEMPREIAYVHLNKSVFIKGENMGLNAYVLDKSNQLPSIETTNLYCTIVDANEHIVKSKMILVQNGIARGDFAIDSLFTTGEYTFKAYTNWMNNFEEQNFFVEKIKVIDPDKTATIASSNANTSVYAQFLPEGGHLIANAENTIGAVIKDSLGFGIPFVEGVVLDSNNTVVTTFKTNRFGIGKFSITPSENGSHKIKIVHDSKKHLSTINNVSEKGIVMSLEDQGDKVALTFKTNQETLPFLKDRYFSLALHNGHTLKTVDVEFGDKAEVLKIIPNSALVPGMNIFTLFDEKNNPLLERQFFNYEGISFKASKEAVVEKKRDSVWITLPYTDVDPEQFSNISISVLPSDTRSYGHHHNLPSYTLLQPYLKGTIENAHYYFSEVTSEKKSALDNLLLTQGWSSYDWGTIFNNPPDYDYDFENGISYVANINGISGGQFLIYPNINNSSDIVYLTNGENSFQRSEIFPLSDEKIKIGQVKANGKIVAPILYLQFSPSEIPDLEVTINTLLNKQKQLLNTFEPSNSDESFNSENLSAVQQLDEVVVTQQVEDVRIEKLRRGTLGTIEVFDDRKRKQYQYFANYISQRGFEVDDNNNYRIGPAPADSRGIDLRPTGQFIILNRNANGLNAAPPLIYLDGVLLTDTSILKSFLMDEIDYIEINKSGIGNGMRAGGGGVIKIVRNPNRAYADLDTEKAYKSYDIPLNFSTPKRFYAPKYSSYSSRFFKEYGVIDWHPNLKIDTEGNVRLKVLNTNTAKVHLYIEGMVNNSTYVSEVKEVQLTAGSGD